MKVVVVGTRGIPNILGGVETHCEELYPRLVEMGCDVTVVRRSSYITPQNQIKSYKGVKLHDIFAPRKKSFEAITHTFLAIIYAKRQHADILHIHAIGPSIMVPFARLLGLKVIMTHHGPDYDRQKWGKLAKAILRLGEKWGVKHSNQVVVISQVIADICSKQHKRPDTHLIYNGVNTPQRATTTQYIESLGLEAGKYILATGRFVKEKNFDLLIKAYAQSSIKNDYRLAIAGDADHPDEYSKSLKQLAHDNNVVLTGFIKGAKLNEILSHAALYVLPSSHEGLPIALLEAMSYNLDVTVSNIPANTLSCLQDDDFHQVGDIDALKKVIERKLNNNPGMRSYDLTPYNWDYIAQQIKELYNSMC